MSKVIGYVIALIGIILIVLRLAFKNFISELPLISAIQPAYITVAGIVLIVIGVFFSLSAGGSKKKREVPIYEGEGKRRKIVGYKMER